MVSICLYAEPLPCTAELALAIARAVVKHPVFLSQKKAATVCMQHTTAYGALIELSRRYHVDPGGIVQPRGDLTNFISGIDGANARSGGATFDTNDFNATVPQILAHSNFEGDSSIDGGLTKNSTGTLTLTASNT